MTYTNRTDFPGTLPTIKTQYCWHCKQPGSHKTGTDPVVYHCNDCGRDAERVLIYDPNMQSRFDAKGRLVHESCGVFIRKKDGKLLLFKRTKFPYLLTIPAGHMEVGEQALPCAIRETEEEVGIKTDDLSLLYEGDIVGDSCLGGADIHYWHAYMYSAGDSMPVKLDEEGSGWDWYELSELTAGNTVQPVLYLLEQPGVASELVR